jgi:histidyl-tRNA synthetase
MKINTNPVKGMRDLLPEEKEIRDYVENTIVEIYKDNGFQLIETPVVENIENLLGSKGGDNLKLIYKIMKRGEKLNLKKENISEDDIAELGLRYDLTIPLSRFYCNNKNNLLPVFKAVQVGNVFRAERAQRGRYRSFKQCDIDIIGDNSSNAEIELLTTSAKALNKLNVENFQIRINDRRILKSVILSCGFTEYEFDGICIILDKLDKIGIEGIRKELNEKKYLSENSERIINALNDIGNNGISSLKKYSTDESVINNINYIIENVKTISKGKYEIVFDFTLVRGMGYYTGPIFEIIYKDLGYSIAGGGRYDEMIGGFINESIPAVGFSIGFERLVNQLIKENFQASKKEKLILIYEESDNISSVIIKADDLRAEGFSVSIALKSKKMSKQLTQYKNQNYTKFAIFNIDTTEIKELD